MVKFIVYDEDNNRLYTYQKEENDPVPYSYDRTLLISEFRGSSKSNVLWTTVRAMEAWNLTRREFNGPIYVGYAFKRIWEGGHGLQSQHYAGVSFDTGQTMGSNKRKRLYNLAKSLGVWGYVEPISMTPTWVHFDRRYGKPACSSGYPILKNGSKGVYVLILQDALNALGYPTKSLDGIFGPNTQKALQDFQRSNNLNADGICGCSTWRKITGEVVGIGRTSTVID